MVEKAITERGTGKAPIDYTVDGACRRWRHTSGPMISAVLPLNLYAKFLGPMLHLSDADAILDVRSMPSNELPGNDPANLASETTQAVPGYCTQEVRRCLWPELADWAAKEAKRSRDDWLGDYTRPRRELALQFHLP